MFSKVASAITLAVCAVGAHAADQAYSWSFQGFTGKHGGPHLPDVKITGQFVVDDLNQDGVFDLSELKAFTYDGVSPQLCITAGNVECQVSAFSYDPAGTLSFNYEYRRRSDGSGRHEWIDTGANFGYAWSSGWDGEDYSYQWDAQTIGTVTAVPEPHAYLMFGAGAMLLAARARRRRAGNQAAT